MKLDKDTVNICLNIAKGCHDYNGGHLEKETNEAFHHGIQTVINCLEKLKKDNGIKDYQLAVIHSVGKKSKTLKKDL